jgi:hypothetical protein
MTIDFEKYKLKRDLAENKAQELIDYVRENCTQSPQMLSFLDQPQLKKEIADNLREFQILIESMRENKK